MIARGFLIAAIAVAMCGCAATTGSDTASSPSSVYYIGDNAALVGANAGLSATEREGEFSVVKRIYWFFAGR
jgi:hypothetical protein